MRELAEQVNAAVRNDWRAGPLVPGAEPSTAAVVEVTNPANGKSVTVTINDRGPFVAGRCLDLSTASFQSIASTAQGVADVEWKVVG